MTCTPCILRKVLGTTVFAAWSVALATSARADDMKPLVTPDQFDAFTQTEEAADIPVGDYMRTDLSNVDIPLAGDIKLSVMDEANRVHFRNFGDYETRPRPISDRVARGDSELYEAATRASVNLRLPF